MTRRQKAITAALMFLVIPGPFWVVLMVAAALRGCA